MELMEFLKWLFKLIEWIKFTWTNFVRLDVSAFVIGESKKNSRLLRFSIIPETSSPKENPDFPADDEDSSLLNVEEKLPEDRRSQLMTPSEVNCLQIIEKKSKIPYLLGFV